MKRLHLTKRVSEFIYVIASAVMLFMLFSLTACNDKNTNYYNLPEVTEGDTFEITLEEPYSDGGWRWSYEIPKSGIEYVTEKFIPDNADPDACGSSGKGIFTFQATQAGSYKIKFKYQRPWEPEISLTESRIYRIKVIKSE